MSLNSVGNHSKYRYVDAFFLEMVVFRSAILQVR